MALRLIAFAGIATFALALPAFADDNRMATPAEQVQVSEALKKAGYDMIDDIHVDNDQFEADAKKDGKDVEIKLDMQSMKILKVTPN